MHMLNLKLFLFAIFISVIAIEQTVDPNLFKSWTNGSRRIYSRQSKPKSGAVCKPKNHVTGGQPNGQSNENSDKQPDQLRRNPCYGYEKQTILLTCAGPEAEFGLIAVADCIPGELFGIHIQNVHD